MTELDTYLNKAYKIIVNEKSKGLDSLNNDLRTAIGLDSTLKTAAMNKLLDLQNLFNARGDKACYTSSIYRKFLEGALNG